VRLAFATKALIVLTNGAWKMWYCIKTRGNWVGIYTLLKQQDDARLVLARKAMVVLY
jgi:hypothetical protein